MFFLARFLIDQYAPANNPRPIITARIAPAAICPSTGRDILNLGPNKLREGWTVGFEEGFDVGLEVGLEVGRDVGRDVGYNVGNLVGFAEGFADGFIVGFIVGLAEGLTAGAASVIDAKSDRSKNATKMIAFIFCVFLRIILYYTDLYRK